MAKTEWGTVNGPPLPADRAPTEQRERLLKAREWTLKTKHQASLDFDKAVMTLAGGALGLTVVFLDKVATPPFQKPALLILAWLALTISLLAILASHLCSVHAHDKLIETTDDVLRDPTRPEDGITWGGWGIATNLLNWCSTGFLILGLLAFLWFAIVNQSGGDNTSPASEGPTMTEPTGGSGKKQPDPGVGRGDKPPPPPTRPAGDPEERGQRPDKPPPPPPSTPDRTAKDTE